MDCRSTSPPLPQLADPRVPLLRTQLLKAQQDALKWCETSAQWKASADRRLAREQEQIARCEELERQLEETKKRHREEKEEWERDWANKKAALISILGDSEQ